jgi:hypothetical protein
VGGVVRLVPRTGVEVVGGDSTPYSDRSMRDVRLVDYSRPGFVVVYRDDAPSQGGEVQLTIRSTRVAPRIEPEESVVGAGGRVRLRNETDAAHVVSAPWAGRIVQLAPGAELELPSVAAGEHELFLLDVAESRATVFAAPGPYTVAGADGRYELTNLEPGDARIVAWRLRFPLVVRSARIPPDQRVELPLEIGVDELGRDGDATR